MLFPRWRRSHVLALPDSPRSILLIRLSARGDVILATPVISALRQRYPEARISWVVETAARDFIANHPEIEDVIVWDRRSWERLLKAGRLGTLFRAIREFRGRLRAHRFDLAIDLHGVLRSGWVAWSSGAPVRIGLGSRELSWLLVTGVAPGLPISVGWLSRHYLELIRRLGLPTTGNPMTLCLSDEDEGFAERQISELGLVDGYVVACPFTTRPQKHWYEDRWARLADRINEEFDLPVLLLPGPGDEPAAERIARQSHKPAIILRGTGLSEAAALVKHASLFIGVDTGLTHAALALETPSLMIYGSHVPYAKEPTSNSRMLLHLQPCAPCDGAITCGGVYQCMRAVTVDEVVTEARSLLVATA